MILEACIAISIHALAGDWNAVHPCVRATNQTWTVGTYYNSESAVSVYGSYTHHWGKWWAEGGLVTGYSGGDIIPMVRGGRDINEKTRWFISPAMTTDGDIGAVFGLEFKL